MRAPRKDRPYLVLATFDGEVMFIGRFRTKEDATAYIEDRKKLSTLSDWDFDLFKEVE